MSKYSSDFSVCSFLIVCFYISIEAVVLESSKSTQCIISCILIAPHPICYVFCWLQAGSADHHIHYFDLRNPSNPLFVFRGHQKAVSYVKFLSPNELASASTDSTLRLWDVQTNCSVRSYCSHIFIFSLLWVIS